MKVTSTLSVGRAVIGSIWYVIKHHTIYEIREEKYEKRPKMTLNARKKKVKCTESQIFVRLATDYDTLYNVWFKSDENC